MSVDLQNCKPIEGTPYCEIYIPQGETPPPNSECEAAEVDGEPMQRCLVLDQEKFDEMLAQGPATESSARRFMDSPEGRRAVEAVADAVDLPWYVDVGLWFADFVNDDEEMAALKMGAAMMYAERPEAEVGEQSEQSGQSGQSEEIQAANEAAREAMDDPNKIVLGIGINPRAGGPMVSESQARRMLAVKFPWFGQIQDRRDAELWVAATVNAAEAKAVTGAEAVVVSYDEINFKYKELRSGFEVVFQDTHEPMTPEELQTKLKQILGAGGAESEQGAESAGEGAGSTAQGAGSAGQGASTTGQGASSTGQGAGTKGKAGRKGRVGGHKGGRGRKKKSSSRPVLGG